jgi:3-hydroxyacyl-[acyl-carrier-protein] dehydratase
MPAAPVATALAVARDHPAYEGHFPGNPILPGVVILAEALASIAQSTAVPMEQWEVASTKFLEPVTPGTPLTLAHERLDNGGVRFEVRSPKGVVASGVLVPRRP